MQFDEFHKRWEKLVFVPMDIGMPPLEYEKICEFMDMFPDHEHENYFRRSLGAEPLIQDYDKEKNFDFFRSFRVYSNKPPYAWQCPIFKEMFPDLESWFETLPLAPGKRLSFGWISQLSPEYNTNFPTSLIHIDEPGNFGFRWFQGNLDNNLYFYGTRGDITIPEIMDLNSNPNDPNDLQWNLFHNTTDASLNSQGLPKANQHFYNCARRIDCPEHTGFILGQTRAAHVIKRESNHNKVTYILEPVGRLEDRWLWQEVSDIIERSIDLYSNQVIWHEDLCD